MAKKVSGHAYKGILEVGRNGRLYMHEIKKDETKVYDLTSVIEEYNAREVSFNIKEDIEPKSIEDTEDEEEMDEEEVYAE